MPTIDVNDMTINYQLGTLLTDIIGQATGEKVLAPVTNSQFVSVATTLLQVKPDIVLDSISQVLSKTIFSIRPYSAKFRGLLVDSIKYGNHVRKLNVIDKPFRDDDRYQLTDGYSVDPWIVDKPEVLQTNYYGQVAIEKALTRFRDQLNIAFSSADEFGRFIAMVETNVSDMLEQERETVARNTVNNLIAGVVAQATADTPIAPERVIYLVDVYNEETGQNLSADDIKNPSYFPNFARWLFGYLKTVSDKLTNRTATHHQNFTIDHVDKIIMRHTPLERQKCYLFGPLLNTVSANVLSTVFYDKYLQLMDHETVDFWQAFNSPMDIKAKPVYTDVDGTVTEAAEAITIENVLGVIFDEEAAGVTQIDEWTAASPFNPRAAYVTQWWHMNLRYWNDFTEKCVVLLLDSAPTADAGGDA